MQDINIHEAKTNLSQIVKRIEERAGRVRLCRHGKPVAEIVPLTTVLVDPLKQDKKLKAILKVDPVLPLDPEDWPER